MKTRHALGITDFSSSELNKVLHISQSLKKKSRVFQSKLLKNKTMVMIFEKPSLRTRVSFESGMTQLGGHAIYLAPADIGLGKRESIADSARVLSRMSDCIMARTFSHNTVVELAQNSTVPVINGLSDLEHPCQTLADLLTIKENFGSLKGLTVAFVGDGENNVTHSLALACSSLGINFRVAAPKGYFMSKEIASIVNKQASGLKSEFIQTDNPREAVKDADVVYTDTWVSMGEEKEKAKRLKHFPPFQVTTKLMQYASSKAIFMHDMPAYRGFEVQAEVIDGRQSVIIDQAENRLHAQKGLLCFLLNVDL